MSCKRGSLPSPGAGGLWGWLCPVPCFFQLLLRMFRLVCSGINKATSKARRTEHAPNRKGGPGMIEFCKQIQHLDYTLPVLQLIRIGVRVLHVNMKHMVHYFLVVKMNSHHSWKAVLKALGTKVDTALFCSCAINGHPFLFMLAVAPGHGYSYEGVTASNQGWLKAPLCFPIQEQCVCNQVIVLHNC